MSLKSSNSVIFMRWKSSCLQHQREEEAYFESMTSAERRAYYREQEKLENIAKQFAEKKTTKTPSSKTPSNPMYLNRRQAEQKKQEEEDKKTQARVEKEAKKTQTRLEKEAKEQNELILWRRQLSMRFPSTSKCSNQERYYTEMQNQKTRVANAIRLQQKRKEEEKAHQAYLIKEKIRRKREEEIRQEKLRNTLKMEDLRKGIKKQTFTGDEVKRLLQDKYVPKECYQEALRMAARHGRTMYLEVLLENVSLRVQFVDILLITELFRLAAGGVERKYVYSVDEQSCQIYYIPKVGPKSHKKTVGVLEYYFPEHSPTAITMAYLAEEKNQLDNSVTLKQTEIDGLLEKTTSEWIDSRKTHIVSEYERSKTVYESRLETTKARLKAEYERKILDLDSEYILDLQSLMNDHKKAIKNVPNEQASALKSLETSYQDLENKQQLVTAKVKEMNGIVGGRKLAMFTFCMPWIDTSFNKNNRSYKCVARDHFFGSKIYEKNLLREIAGFIGS